MPALFPCHFEPFTLCHSEPSEESRAAQDKLRVAISEGVNGSIRSRGGKVGMDL